MRFIHSILMALCLAAAVSAAPPVITVQPTNETTVVPAAATFGVTATGAVSYQWQTAETSALPLANISGATASTYSTGAVALYQNQSVYRVIALNGDGADTSDIVLLIVTPTNPGKSLTVPNDLRVYGRSYNYGLAPARLARFDSSQRLANHAALTANGMVYAGDPGGLVSLPPAGNGQVLLGNSGNPPAVGSVAGTTNEIEMTAGPGTLQIGIPNSFTMPAATPAFAQVSVAGSPASNLQVATKRYTDSAIAAAGGGGGGGGCLADPAASIGLTAVNGSDTCGIRSDAAQALSQGIAPTWTAKHTHTVAPRFNSVTADQVLMADGSKDLTSVGTTGTGTFMRSGSPTTTGTFTADAVTASSLVTGAGFASSATNIYRTVDTDSAKICGGTVGSGMCLSLTGGSAANYGGFSLIQNGDTVMWSNPNSRLYIEYTTHFTSNVTVVPNATLEVQYHLLTSGQALFTHGRTAATLSAVTETAGAIAIDISNSDFYSITLDDNSTLSNPVNSSSGRHFTIRVRQDGTGGNTLGFGNTYRFPDGIVPDINTDANSVNYYSFIYDEVADKWDFIGNAFNLLPAGT